MISPLPWMMAVRCGGIFSNFYFTMLCIVRRHKLAVLGGERR